ncbi:hypothetical protein Pse7367_3198 [Thalassoporum mexicanum PCC 7367]|nr:hypothetical protein Pse7367_3198 [Pseudanabaena sp. PCC 7367]
MTSGNMARNIVTRSLDNAITYAAEVAKRHKKGAIGGNRNPVIDRVLLKCCTL